MRKKEKYKKKIHIVGTVGLPADYGGWETMVENISKDLCQEYEITVYCSSKHYKKEISNHPHANLRYLPLKATGWQSIIYDYISILSSIYFRADVILILGVSGCTILPFVRLFKRPTIITNIDGLEWKRGKWGFFAKLFLKISEYFAVRFSHKVIGDNVEIVRYINKNYNKNAYFIAFGGSSRDGIDNLSLSKITSQPFALNISRIEPENNIHLILEACLKEKLHIHIFGRWNANDYSRKLYQQYADSEYCNLHEHLSNQKILNAYRKKSLVYIHGHSVGGTNPSLVEAMSWGIPIFAFDVIYNVETTFNSALYFSNVDDLRYLIKSMDPIKMSEISKKMQQLHNENYEWKVISGKYSEHFKIQKN